MKQYKRLHLEDGEIEETQNAGDVSRVEEEANKLRADVLVLQTAFVQAVRKDPRYEDRKDMVELVMENLVQECHRNAAEKSRLVPLWKEVEKKKGELEERERFLKACRDDERLHRGLIAYYRSDLRDGVLPREQLARVDKLRREQQLERRGSEKQKQKVELQDRNKSREPAPKDKKTMVKATDKYSISSSHPFSRRTSRAVQSNNPNFEPVKRSRLGTIITTIDTDKSPPKSPTLGTKEQSNIPPVVKRSELESSNSTMARISDTQLTTASRKDKQPRSDSHMDRAKDYPSSESSRPEPFHKQPSATSVVAATVSTAFHEAHAHVQPQPPKSPKKQNRPALATKQSNLNFAPKESVDSEPPLPSTSKSTSARTPSPSPSLSKASSNLAPPIKKPSNIDSNTRIPAPSPDEKEQGLRTATKSDGSPREFGHKKSRMRSRSPDGAKSGQVDDGGRVEQERERESDVLDEKGMEWARSFAWR